MQFGLFIAFMEVIKLCPSSVAALGESSVSSHFARIAYTPSVKAMQRRYVGREAAFGSAQDLPELGGREREFIALRDSFYLATVSEDGWPHVQHRGGPAGFLKVLAADRLAFADCGGNQQMVSVGNLSANPRAALILMDYPKRRRLKILGEVTVMEAGAADASLLEAVLETGGPPAERIMLIRVAAFDWNCSKFITPRFTESEWQANGLPLANC